MDRFDKVFDRYRGVVVLGIVALSLAALAGHSRLQFEDVPGEMLSTHNADAELWKEVSQDFGSDDNDCVIVLEGDDLLSSTAIDVIRKLVRDVEQVAGVESVWSMVGSQQGALDRSRSAALDYPMISRSLLSADGRTMLVIVRLARTTLAVGEIEPIVNRLRQIVSAATEGTSVRARITGIPAVHVELLGTLRRDQVKFALVGIMVAALIAWALFRRLSAVVIVALPPLLGTFWTMGALGLAGQKINIILSVVPTLILVIGFSDAVHLMVHFQRRRAKGSPASDAAWSAVRHLALPCGLTSLTTGIGFGSLVLADNDAIQRLGVSCAYGSMLSFVAVLTGVYLLASTRLGKHAVPTGSDHRHKRLDQLLKRVGAPIVRHSYLVAALGTLTTLCLALTALNLQPDNQLTESIPVSNESYQALKHCDDVLGGALSLHVLIQWPESCTLSSPDVLGAIGDVHKLLEEQPAVRDPVSVVGLLPDSLASTEHVGANEELLSSLPKSVVNRFLCASGRCALVSGHVRNLGASAHEPLFQDLENGLTELQRRYPNVKAHLTGSVVVASRTVNQMIGDLAKSLGMAAVVIFALMTLTFRSVRLGLISVIPNIFPLVAAGSLLVWLGEPLRLSSVIVFSICLGIAVDDTIYFLTHFRREYRAGCDLRAAIRHTLVGVGSAVVTTTAILVAGIAALLLSEVPTLRMFGILSCTAMLAALVGDLVILPALLCCFFRSSSRRPSLPDVHQ